MPIDADLGTIELKTSEKTETVDSDVLKIDAFDDDEKKKLDAEFAKSEVSNWLKTKLEGIKSDVNKSREGKKNDMVSLLKGFFAVGNDKDAHINRFVVDGKSYMRINDGENRFDIELSDALMPSLVNRFLDKSEAQINEGIKEEEKIKLNRKVEIEIVKNESKEELATLQGEVTEDFRDRKKFKKDPGKWIKGLGPWIQGTLGSVKSFFTDFTDTIPKLGTTIKETVSSFKGFSLGGLLGKKVVDETKPA